MSIIINQDILVGKAMITTYLYEILWTFHTQRLIWKKISHAITLSSYFGFSRRPQNSRWDKIIYELWIPADGNH